MKKLLRAASLAAALGAMQNAHADLDSERMKEGQKSVIGTLKNMQQDCGVRVITHEIRDGLSGPVTEIAFSYAEENRDCVLRLLDQSENESCIFFNPQSKLIEGSSNPQASFLIDCNPSKEMNIESNKAELICNNYADKVSPVT